MCTYTHMYQHTRCSLYTSLCTSGCFTVQMRGADSLDKNSGVSFSTSIHLSDGNGIMCHVSVT